LAGEIVRFLDEADLQQPPEERLHQP
jgi:hypothetical protein